ncbi:hypothetical protein G4H71_03180 [Rhodococcus triatomae]|nr:hypothetical protein G4H72_04865 [Rhodococcus triatomae]QNG25493.1 hypothetical protein G4H71_03180 [Rhodococcus triatomae]
MASSWKPVLDSALSGGPLSVDPDGLRRCIQLCQDHADAMGRFAERARHELRVDSLGIGEADLESAQLLMEKFNDKALGGGQIAFESSALGLFRAHQSFARDMKSTFEGVLRAYEEQEGITVDNLGSVGGDL